MGPRCFVFLALPVALLVAGIAPAVGLAQPAETHGEVSQVSGDQVVIQLNEPTTVSDTARGRVFAQGETSTAVAEVTVQSTRGTLVLGRIAEELGRATVQTGAAGDLPGAPNRSDRWGKRHRVPRIGAERSDGASCREEEQSNVGDDPDPCEAPSRFPSASFPKVGVHPSRSCGHRASRYRSGGPRDPESS